MTDQRIKNEASSIVFVLGMHRSGTSALAKVLGYAGGHIPADVLAPNQGNPRGYWEPRSVVELNNRFLQLVDRHWSDPKPLSPEQRESLLNSVNVDAAVAVLRSELDAMGSSKRPLVLKDPRLCRLIPVWREAAAACGLESQCLIASRNPFEVAESLFARDRMKLFPALELWLTYMLEAERGTRGMGRTVVSFEDLMTDWRRTLATAVDAVGTCGIELDSAAGQVVKFLDRRLIKSHERSDSLVPLSSMHRIMLPWTLAKKRYITGQHFAGIAQQEALSVVQAYYRH